MAARGSGGLLLCVALLLAMPALAATPADRGECAASADKPDVGGAACSRIIDDASEQLAERVEKGDPNDCCSQGANPDEARVNRRSRQSFYRFTQQKKYRIAKTTASKTVVHFEGPTERFKTNGHATSNTSASSMYTHAIRCPLV